MYLLAIEVSLYIRICPHIIQHFRAIIGKTSIAILAFENPSSSTCYIQVAREMREVKVLCMTAIDKQRGLPSPTALRAGAPTFACQILY